jgi:hypothetical protein
MISILKEVRVATFLMLSVFSVLGFAQETRRFEVYQSMGFDTLPTAVMDKHGIKQLTLYGHGHLWVKKDPFLPEPNFAEIKNRASASKKNNDTLVSLDIEMWEFDPKVTSKNKKTIDRFVNVAKTFRQQSPDVRFGFYSQLPLRNYWDPIRNSKKLASGYADWQAVNRSMQPIADQVDVIMPSLYTFYKDRAGWLIYAEENIKEARKYGKPVYIYLWPQYTPDTDAKLARAEFIDHDFWKLQLETVFRLADGVIIWTPKGINQKWNENAPWWNFSKRNASGWRRIHPENSI